MLESATIALSRPVIIQWMYRDDAGRRVVLTTPEHGSSMRAPFYSTPLRASFVAFLAQHGRCAACDQPAPADLRACACGKDGPDVLDLLLSGARQEEFDQLLSKELDFHRKTTRIEAGKPDHNQLTVDEVALLLDLQDGLCFYCANELPRGQDGPLFDRDHYVPIKRGGKTTLENTVLTCPRCNQVKGKTDGYTFGLQMLRARKPEMRARYAKMRTRFRQGMRRLGSKHIACDADRAALVLRRPSSD